MTYQVKIFFKEDSTLTLEKINEEQKNRIFIFFQARGVASVLKDDREVFMNFANANYISIKPELEKIEKLPEGE